MSRLWFILLFPLSVHAALPFADGDYHGGGFYRFVATGLSGPFSIHWNLTTTAENTLQVTIDNSLSSTGALELTITADDKQNLTITDINNKVVGSGFCNRTACQLIYSFESINIIGAPKLITIDESLVDAGGDLIEFGLITETNPDGSSPRLISMHNTLKRAEK